MDVLEREWFLMQHGRMVSARVFPRGGVTEIRVIANGFAIGSLMLLAKMRAAGFIAIQASGSWSAKWVA
jgi:hypothetical protein